jgi:hypothetical protein
MVDFDYKPYTFNPTAEAPKFLKGDAPALLRTEDLSDVFIRIKQSINKKDDNGDENLDLKPPPKGWVQLTSPKGRVVISSDTHKRTRPVS